MSPSLLMMLKEGAGRAHESLANVLVGREQMCQLLSRSALKGKITAPSKICLHWRFVECARGPAR